MGQAAAVAIQEMLKRIDLQGWCILEGVIPSDKVGDISKRVQTAVEAKVTEEKIRGLGNRGGLIAFDQSFAPFLGDPRILGVAEALFGSHYRISFTSAQVNYPGNDRGGLHADWPFNQNNAGHIPAPYPNAVQHLTTIWMLSPFTEETGATIIVPGSHRQANNPTGDNGVDPLAPFPGEIRATGEAGSVLLFDSRLWHAVSQNTSDQPRIGMAVRYAPWWLNLDVLMPGSVDRVRMVDETGISENTQLPVPQIVYDGLPEDVKSLYLHWVRS